MPWDLVTEDIVEVTMDGEYQGSKIMNVWHYYVNVTGESTDYFAALGAFLTQWVAGVWSPVGGLQERMVDTYTLNRVRAQVVGPDRKPYADLAVNQTGGGDVIGVPSNVTMVQNIRSDKVGKGTSGGKHLTALPLEWLEGAYWGAGFVTNVQAALQNALDGFATVAPAVIYTPCLFERETGNAYDIIGSNTSNQVRIMHRRTVHLGE